MGLLIVGFGFKVALVPFHMWTPDVYQGAPTPVTAFMSVATKAAAFAALMRVLCSRCPPACGSGCWRLAILAVLTMTLGNLAASRQTNLKRMLAYSSIAHAGYIAGRTGRGHQRGRQRRAVLPAGLRVHEPGRVRRGRGPGALGTRRRARRARLPAWRTGSPPLAAAMTVFMFSLAGIPPLAGFFAKFYVFSAAVQARAGRGWRSSAC